MKKKLLTAALALGIAVAAWLYVVIFVGPEYQETFRDIKVEFVGETSLRQKNLMVLKTEIPTVDVVLSGNRSDLIKVNHADISVTLDLAQIQDPVTKEYRYDITLPSNVSGGSVIVESLSSSGITLEVVATDSKPIPVEVKYDEGAIATGFVPLEVEQELEELQIYGPADVVGQITFAKIWLELDENKEDNKSDISGEYVATLCDAKGQEVDARYVTVTTPGAEVIHVTLPILMKKTLPLRVNLIDGGGATTENTTVKYAPETITVLGREDVLKDYNEIFLGDIDLAEVPLDGEPFVLPISLKDGVIDRSGLTEATVTLTLPDLTEQVFNVSREQFRITGNSDDTVPVIDTEQVKVTVRGTEAAVSALTPEMFTIYIDVTNVPVDQPKDWVVLVQLENAPEGVGVVGGPYKVLIELKKNTQE